ncbi:MAG: hypothetical protein ACRCUU_04675 [Plesiomonas sp.]
MTPCEEKGYAVGDMFLMVLDDEILELVEDDDDNVPLFRNNHTGRHRYVHMDHVTPVKLVVSDMHTINTQIARLEQELKVLHEQRREIINRNDLNK